MSARSRINLSLHLQVHLNDRPVRRSDNKVMLRTVHFGSRHTF